MIQVEKGLAMHLVQFEGMVKDFLPKNKHISLIDYFIQLKEEIWDKFNIAFQIVNPKYLISEDQLKLILHHVYFSFSSKTNISKQYGVEFLLYLSHERQITKAIEKVGIKNPNDLKDMNKIEICEILFGEPEKLKQAIKFLENKISISKHSQFKYLEINEWETFMETYQISIDHVVYILRGYNTKIKNEIKSLDELKSMISSELIRKAIADAFNIGMVKLYLDNFKRNVEK